MVNDRGEEDHGQEVGDQRQGPVIGGLHDLTCSASLHLDIFAQSYLGLGPF